MATLDIIVKPKLKFTLKKCGDVVPYGITPEEREKLAGIEENANNYTHPETHPASIIEQDANNRFITDVEREKLAGIEENANNYTHPETHPASILDVVDVVNGDAKKFLNERGEMVAVATSSIGVTGSQLYASTVDSDVDGYKSLVGTPQALETEIALTAKSSDGIVWGAKYLSAPFTEAVTIPATAYGFDYWRKVSAANGTSRKHLRVFLYRAGEETNIGNILVSPDINETEFTERQISYIFPELVLLAGDRIGIQEGFSTTHANNITLTYIVGDGRGWFMRLPLPLKHEKLTDKNDEAAFQHVDTTTTKSGLDNGDKVALYDSVTGKMVLSDTLTDEYLTELAESLYSYGVVFDQNLSTTTLYRIGNQELHRTLPVQSGMKRCLLLDNGTVNYYTHPNNTLLKEDGITASILDGTDGQLMVEVPEHWRKFTTLTDERFEVRLSMVEIPGYHKVAKFYVSAFEATVHRPTNKLSSVINLSPNYRGGNNNAAWDGAANTLLGRPASTLSLTNFRTYARNRGAKWNVLPYEQYKSIWYLYMVEYANTNVQLPVSAPDPTGLKTGGLGNGVTDANSTEWNNFNGYNPFIPCGASVMPGIGNLSGEKTYTATNFGGTGVNRTFKVPSYRGIENIFGHIWKHTDGVLIEVKTDADGGTSKLYTQSNPAMFADVITNYTYRGNLARSGGYIKKLLFGTNGDILPTQVGGGSTTYYADSFETNIASSQTRCVLLSAYAAHGAAAGLSYAYTHNVPASAYAYIGARLCYIP